MTSSSTGFGSVLRGSTARVFGLLMLVCSVVVVGVPSAHAGYEWCSVDPLLTFQREGAPGPVPVDIQIFIPRSQLPYKRQAQLRVTPPANVVGTVALDTSQPLYFNLRTYFTPTSRVVRSGYYPISVRLLVPTPSGVTPFDTELLITKPNSDEIIARVAGKSGQYLRSTFWITE